ncbi:MAG: hypothetical protein ACJ70V_06615 [Nitrososphaera sp.]
MSKVSVCKALEFRKRSNASDVTSTGTAEATMRSTTARTIRKIPTPFQAERVMLISKLKACHIQSQPSCDTGRPWNQPKAILPALSEGI